MNHSQNMPEMNVTQEIERIEDILKTFWEKARSATELILRLREEKRNLYEKQAEFENELQKLRSELLVKDQEIKHLKTEQSQLLNINSDDIITAQEKEVLKSRIKDLIAKINSHL